MQTILVILSMIGAVALAVGVIALVWYYTIEPLTKEEDNDDVYEVVYITLKEFEMLNNNQMLELIIYNKKVIIKIY